MAARDRELQATTDSLRQRLGQWRASYEQEWWANMLFKLGHQWITYDPLAQRWRQRKLARSVPQPVTNLFRATLDTIQSVLAQHQPRFVCTPLHDDPKSVAAAAAADSQLTALLQSGGFRRVRRRMLGWLMTTGNAFIEPVVDLGPDTGTETVPASRCLDCGEVTEPQETPEDGQCEHCGGVRMVDDFSQTMQVPRGALRFDLRTPFSIYLDPRIDTLQDQPMILDVSRYTTEQVGLTWNVDVEPDTRATSGQQLEQSIATMGAPVPGEILGSRGALVGTPSVTVIRAFVKRHKDFPKGAFWTITANGEVLEAPESDGYPYRWSRTGAPFYPLVHFRFGAMEGRAWGYTPADDLRSKQASLNRTESLIKLILARMGSPIWLIPSGTNPSTITGETGLQVEYTAIGGNKPEKVSGSEVPNALVKLLVDERQAFDELSGAFSAVRGRSMGTRTPVGTVQQLVERGFGRWATVFEDLEEGYEDLAKRALEIWRQAPAAPMIVATKNALGGFTLQQFAGADLTDGIDVQVEAGSARPRTQQEKLQTYLSLQQAGWINIGDRSQVVKILEDLGMVNLLPGVEEDAKLAYQENARFMQWAVGIAELVLQQGGASAETQAEVQARLATPPLLVHPLIDNHEVHFLTHRRLALTPEYERLPDICKQWFEQNHLMQHRQMYGQSQIPAPVPTAPPAAAGPVPAAAMASGNGAGRK